MPRTRDACARPASVRPSSVGERSARCPRSCKPKARQQRRTARAPPPACGHRGPVAAGQQISIQDQKQQQCAGQPRVPLPPNAPRFAPPQRSRHQRARAKQHAQFARGMGQPIAALRAPEQIRDAAPRRREGRCEHHDRAGDVEIENLLHQPHDRLDGRRQDQQRHREKTQRGDAKAAENPGPTVRMTAPILASNSRNFRQGPPHVRRQPDPRVSLGSPHRRHLCDHRGRQTRVSLGRGGLVQPGPGAAGDRTAAGLAGACPPDRDRRRRSGVRAHPGDHRAAGRDRGALQPALPARAAVAVHRRKRQRLGRRARVTDPRRGQPRET